MGIERGLKIEQVYGRALRHYQAGQLSQAEALYRQVLAKNPTHAGALYDLGVIAYQTGRLDAAVDLIRKALTQRPNWPEAYNNLAIALGRKDEMDQAIAACRQAIAIKPDFPEAFNNLANALRYTGRLQEAITAYRQAIVLKPNNSEAYNNLGNALKDTGQLDQAIAAYRTALALRPNYPEAHNNLGIVLREKGQLDEAIAAYRQAITINPNFADAYSSLGAALNDMCQLDAAAANYHRAIALMPDFAEAHRNLGLNLLLRGEFPHGWDEYEWRSKCRNPIAPQRHFAQPQWAGELLEGRTLLLHAEQGFGDTLHFIRYLSLVSQRGGNVILECQAQLQHLMQLNFPGHTIIARGELLPNFDLHSPLMSLPRIFRMTLENIPGDVPYLHPIADEVQTLRKRLAIHSQFLKVGLAWAGSPTHKNDRNRSIELARLAPLAKVPETRFVGAQTGEAASQVKSAPVGMELIDMSEELKDFADTAALIANLDLVISVDTAIVHLAGAMGKPVWVLLPFLPDWRWLLEREDSPWYPTMRLFRQKRMGDWPEVIERVAKALGEFRAGLTQK